MKTAVVVFADTNRDVDTFIACKYLGLNPEYVSHEIEVLDEFDLVVIPGGFLDDDYIDSNIIEKSSNIIHSVKDFVEKKRGFVVGIGSGFQTLCECGLLPGTLVFNNCRRSICEDAELVFIQYGVHRRIQLPIAHSQGCYVADFDTLRLLEDKNMVFLRYKKNPNGSICDIAGVYDQENHVIGMMPHPERAVFKEFGSTDGKLVFGMVQSELLDLMS